MAKPERDDRDIDARLQQVQGCRVPDRMWRQGARLQAGMITRRPSNCE